MLNYSINLAKYSSNKKTFIEVITLSSLWFIEQLAFSVGEFKGLKNIIIKSIKND